MAIRTTMGIMADEKVDCITDKDADGSYSNLQLPAPSLVDFESPNGFPIKWYFGAHIILKNESYYLVFGDQIADTVFICAVHEVGNSIPTCFLCLDAAAFHNWLTPMEGNEAIEPPCEAWGFHNARQFCGNTMKATSTDAYHFKACIETKSAFEKAVLSMIAHLLEVRQKQEYSFIFKVPSQSSVNVNAQSTDDITSSAGNQDHDHRHLTRAEKAARTREEKKLKEKERFVPSRGSVIVDVNQIKSNIETAAAAAKGNYYYYYHYYIIIIITIIIIMIIIVIIINIY